MNEIFKNLTWNKKIEVLRIIKGWTQLEAAKRCFTNQKGFWAWEKGNVYPIENSRRAIAQAFQVDEDFIFGNNMEE